MAKIGISIIVSIPYCPFGKARAMYRYDSDYYLCAALTSIILTKFGKTGFLPTAIKGTLGNTSGIAIDVRAPMGYIVSEIVTGSCVAGGSGSLPSPSSLWPLLSSALLE